MSPQQKLPLGDAEPKNLPLPLIVAERWGFPLAFHIVDGQHMYAIQDWMRGLLGVQDTRYMWAKFKKQHPHSQALTSSQRLKYKTSDGKSQLRDFLTDNGLYFIAQYLRATQDRPMLNEIRQYLANAGKLVDELRRDESAIIITSKMSPEQKAAAVKKAKRVIPRGTDKSDQWVASRTHTKEKRKEFTAALTRAVIEMLSPKDYATITDDIYMGLWERTAAILRREMELPQKANLRDYQPRLALHFQGIVEELTAYELGERQEVTWEEARRIVQKVAKMVRAWVKEAQEQVTVDIATGRPLLTVGQ